MSHVRIVKRSIFPWFEYGLHNGAIYFT